MNLREEFEALRLMATIQQAMESVCMIATLARMATHEADIREAIRLIREELERIEQILQKGRV